MTLEVAVAPILPCLREVGFACVDSGLMVVCSDDVVQSWDNEQSKCRSDGHSRYQDDTDAVAGFRTRTDHHHQREMPENRGG